MNSPTLVKYDAARRALAGAHRVDEVKDIRDKAMAVAAYAKQAKDGELIRMATEIKIRAERRVGELWREMEKHEGGRPSKTPLATRGVLPPTLKQLGITYDQSSTWQQLAALPEREFERRLAVAAGEVPDGLSTERILRPARWEANEAKRMEIQRRRLEQPTGRFQTLVIDPPWPMEKIERDLYSQQVGFDYPTMTEEQLRELPVANWAEEDCHLYLWTTHKHLPVALRLAESWGFRYQCLLTWVKNVGFTPYSWMYSTEHALFCRRGNLGLLALGRRLDFTAARREHSRKPEVFYALVRDVSPGPRLDVFSREPHEGFSQWGLEAERFA